MMMEIARWCWCQTMTLAGVPPVDVPGPTVVGPRRSWRVFVCCVFVNVVCNGNVW